MSRAPPRRHPVLTPQIMDPVRTLGAQFWPGVTIVPTLSVGATDGPF